MRWHALLAMFLAGCGGNPAAVVTPPAANQKPQGSLALEHDFGVIPHGESRQHEFQLDLARLDEPWVPLRVHLDCSCGHADLRLRTADGKERFVEPNGSASNRPGPGETLWLRVVLDTKTKEAIDLPRTQSRGFVVLQLASDMTGSSRVQWPLLVHFGIEAPVQLRPLATLDFGRVPLSGRGVVVTSLRGDERHADATFTSAVCSDPHVTVELQKEADHWLLRATCTPHELGNHRATVTITHSIAGYHLELVTTWKVVPDLEAVPVPKVSVRAPLQRAQRPEEATGQYLVLVDHDVSRSAEFAVWRCVDDGGADLSAHFAITFEPIANSPRQRRMYVRCLGGLQQGVRGSIVLTKNGESGPFLPIELVVFASKDA